METKSQLYIPSNAHYLNQESDNEFRIGLQGYPFVGKTTSALTFPNPIPLSFDKKLSAHSNRTDMPIIPFYDGGFVDSIVRRDGTSAPPNQKDALIKWLMTEGTKLTSQQTLISDGLTGMETAFHVWFKQNEDAFRTKKGDLDGFAEWNEKKKFFDELWNCFKSLKCGVILITHEQDARNKDGSYNGKIRPLLTGQSADKMGMNFTDWFRCLAWPKPETKEQLEAFSGKVGISIELAKEWCSEIDPIYKTIHLWQTQSDDTADCGTTSLFKCPKFIPADYKHFCTYKRNKQTQ